MGIRMANIGRAGIGLRVLHTNGRAGRQLPLPERIRAAGNPMLRATGAVLKLIRRGARNKPECRLYLACTEKSASFLPEPCLDD
jgi:hypothetical protein